MIKKLDLALETVAELFLTAFNGEISGRGVLERAPAPEMDENARWFRQTFTGVTSFEFFAGFSTELEAAFPGQLNGFVENVFYSVAQTLETLVGSVVSCYSLTEETAPRGVQSVAWELRGDSAPSGTVVFAVPEATLNFLKSVFPEPASAEDSRTARRPAPLHLDALMNVDLPVSISFGTAEMLLADVMKLTTGSIVEFQHLLHEPVNVVVNGCLVAKGDVVVVEGNYGVRVSEVLDRA
jgi:flagellar motor switch protein FliN